jgi:hypothetical protein
MIMSYDISYEDVYTTAHFDFTTARLYSLYSDSLSHTLTMLIVFACMQQPGSQASVSVTCAQYVVHVLAGAKPVHSCSRASGGAPLRLPAETFAGQDIPFICRADAHPTSGTTQSKRELARYHLP